MYNKSAVLLIKYLKSIKVCDGVYSIHLSNKRNKKPFILRFQQNMPENTNKRIVVSTSFDHDVSTGYYLRIYFLFLISEDIIHEKT